MIAFILYSVLVFCSNELRFLLPGKHEAISFLNLVKNPEKRNISRVELIKSKDCCDNGRHYNLVNTLESKGVSFNMTNEGKIVAYCIDYNNSIKFTEDYLNCELFDQIVEITALFCLLKISRVIYPYKNLKNGSLIQKKLYKFAFPIKKNIQELIVYEKDDLYFILYFENGIPNHRLIQVGFSDNNLCIIDEKTESFCFDEFDGYVLSKKIVKLEDLRFRYYKDGKYEMEAFLEYYPELYDVSLLELFVDYRMFVFISLLILISIYFICYRLFWFVIMILIYLILVRYLDLFLIK